MKTYQKPVSTVLELQVENLIATSGGKNIGLSDKFADKNSEALSAKKNPIWE